MTGDFKGQIPVPMCIRHQDKVTTATAAGSAASLDEMVQTATNTFYNREQEREVKAQERERRKEIRTCLDAGRPPGKPYGKSQVLEGQGRRKMPNL